MCCKRGQGMAAASHRVPTPYDVSPLVITQANFARAHPPQVALQSEMKSGYSSLQACVSLELAGLAADSNWDG
jgi:hypothetical protein